MVQSPSWVAICPAASQEIPRISRNPKVHYRTHKRPPPVSILGQPNPVHIPTSHLLEIRPSIIHPSTPRSPQWSRYVPTWGNSRAQIVTLFYPFKNRVHVNSNKNYSFCLKEKNSISTAKSRIVYAVWLIITIYTTTQNTHAYYMGNMQSRFNMKANRIQ